MTTVIGVDPGGTTGLAVVDYHSRKGYTLTAHESVAFLPTEVAAWVESWAGARLTVPDGAPWIAAERFVVNRRASRSRTAAAGERARNILGALETTFPGRVKLRNAGAAKAWATDDRLKAAGLWPTQGRPHTTDAVRHALFMLVATFGHPDPLGTAYRPPAVETS